MIKRSEYLADIEARLAVNPVVALLGPRQTGKTTLARQIAATRPTTFLDQCFWFASCRHGSKTSANAR